VKLRFLFFLSIFINIDVFASDQPLVTVETLLQKASKALQEKDYKGMFTYEYGSTITTVELVHMVNTRVVFLPEVFYCEGA